MGSVGWETPVKSCVRREDPSWSCTTNVVHYLFRDPKQGEGKLEIEAPKIGTGYSVCLTMLHPPGVTAREIRVGRAALWLGLTVTPGLEFRLQ